MRSTSTIELSTGLFVLLGFAALFFLSLQITNRELSTNGSSYGVTAKFENIGSLKVGAAVSMSGVTIGRVESIALDQNIYKAVVQMKIKSTYDHLPKDSDASIMTAGLLGSQYIGITAGGAEDFLKEGDQIQLVQDALVLENLINQLAASFAGPKDKDSDKAEDASQAESGKTEETPK